jgi:hypothetical protein
LSVQGLQKAAQVLNAVGQLLPVIGEADAEGLDVAKLINGSLLRMGVAAPELVAAVVAIVQPPVPDVAS